MLEKLGKTDLGESAKAMGLVFVIGLLLAIIGGTLLAVSANDTTQYADSDLIDEDGDDAIDANAMIGHFHQTGKNLIGLLAFWLPLIGIIMIAIGLGTLSLKRKVTYAVISSVGIAIALVSFQDMIPMYVMATAFAVALSADVASTVTSKKFPKYECNVIIHSLQKRVGMKKTWIAYCASYGIILAAGLAFLDANTTLGIMAAVHVVAAIGNVSQRRSARKIVLSLKGKIYDNNTMPKRPQKAQCVIH